MNQLSTGRLQHLKTSGAQLVIMAIVAIAVHFGTAFHFEEKLTAAHQTIQEKEELRLAEVEKAEELGFANGFNDGMVFAETQKAKRPVKPKGFLPKTPFPREKEALCMAIVVYGEARGGKPVDREVVAWTLVNRAMDPRDDTIYQETVCKVARAGGGSQYNAAKAYINTLGSIIWSGREKFTPLSAQKNKDEMQAWKEILQLSKDIMDGKRKRLTKATHFYSPANMEGGRRPRWAQYFKPLGYYGGHLVYVDNYISRRGEQVVYDRSNPYRT